MTAGFWIMVHTWYLHKNIIFTQGLPRLSFWLPIINTIPHCGSGKRKPIPLQPTPSSPLFILSHTYTPVSPASLQFLSYFWGFPILVSPSLQECHSIFKFLNSFKWEWTLSSSEFLKHQRLLSNFLKNLTSKTSSDLFPVEDTWQQR